MITHSFSLRSWKAKGVRNHHARNPGCRNTSAAHEHRLGGWVGRCLAGLTVSLTGGTGL